MPRFRVRTRKIYYANAEYEVDAPTDVDADIAVTSGHGEVTKQPYIYDQDEETLEITLIEGGN